MSISSSNLPYGFTFTDNGDGTADLSANPVPFELPDGTSLVHHGDPDGDGKWDTLTQEVTYICTDGVDTTTVKANLIVEDTNRSPYITSPYPSKTTYDSTYDTYIDYDIDCSDHDKEDIPNLWYNMHWGSSVPAACGDNDPTTLCSVDHSTGQTSIEIMPGDVGNVLDMEYLCIDLPGGSLDLILVEYRIF